MFIIQAFNTFILQTKRCFFFSVLVNECFLFFQIFKKSFFFEAHTAFQSAYTMQALRGNVACECF